MLIISLRIRVQKCVYVWFYLIKSLFKTNIQKFAWKNNWKDRHQNADLFDNGDMGFSPFPPLFWILPNFYYVPIKFLKGKKMLLKNCGLTNINWMHRGASRPCAEVQGGMRHRSYPGGAHSLRRKQKVKQIITTLWMECINKTYAISSLYRDGPEKGVINWERRRDQESCFLIVLSV